MQRRRAEEEDRGPAGIGDYVCRSPSAPHDGGNHPERNGCPEQEPRSEEDVGRRIAVVVPKDVDGKDSADHPAHGEHEQEQENPETEQLQPPARA
jgi:hypothetical protein